MKCVFYTTQEAVRAARPILEPVFVEMQRRTPCRDFTVDDLFELAEEGRAVLGAVFYGDAVMLAGAFEFRYYPRHVAVNIMSLGGANVGEAMAYYWETFRAWCKDAGASVIEARCAPAMTRLMVRNGFIHEQNVVRQIL